METQSDFYTIKEIQGDGQLEESVDVVCAAFKTVAADLGLTKENCPTNPAFLDSEAMRRLKEKGAVLFGLFLNERIVGFVAVQKSKSQVFYMERLAVHPDFRFLGLGQKLIDFVFDYVKQLGGIKIAIGIINENKRLKNWYRAYGFTETGLKNFDHLPFTVCFMEKEVC